MILILGGSQFATLEVEIYRQTAELLDLRTAAVLSLLQMTALAVLLFAYSRYQQRTAVRVPTADRPARRRAARARAPSAPSSSPTWPSWPCCWDCRCSSSSSARWPARAATASQNFQALFASDQRSALFVPPIDAVRNSLLFALIATLICAPLGLMAAYVIARGRGRLASGFDALLMLPLGTSAVIVGFGFLVALGNLPIDLRTSIILIPIAHAVVALPFLVRATVPVLRSVDERLREAARVLGASPARVWREIDLPIVRAPC